MEEKKKDGRIRPPLPASEDAPDVISLSFRPNSGSLFACTHMEENGFFIFVSKNEKAKKKKSWRIALLCLALQHEPACQPRTEIDQFSLVSYQLNLRVGCVCIYLRYVRE